MGVSFQLYVHYIEPLSSPQDNTYPIYYMCPLIFYDSFKLLKKENFGERCREKTDFIQYAKDSTPSNKCQNKYFLSAAYKLHKRKCVENVFGENVLNGNIYIKWLYMILKYVGCHFPWNMECQKSFLYLRVYVLYKLNFSSNTWSSASNRNNETPFCLTILINQDGHLQFFIFKGNTNGKGEVNTISLKWAKFSSC